MAILNELTVHSSVSKAFKYTVCYKLHLKGGRDKMIQTYGLTWYKNTDCGSGTLTEREKYTQITYTGCPPKSGTADFQYFAS